jgi:hypothetical protein
MSNNINANTAKKFMAKASGIRASQMPAKLASVPRNISKGISEAVAKIPTTGVGGKLRQYGPSIVKGGGILGLGAAVAAGAAGMAAVAMMNGAQSRAHDVMNNRYMRDSRYSSRLLTQTQIGQSMGNSKLSIGNHTGLSLSLHSGRHG